jgi:DnaJ-class molecular chaperone
VSDEPASTSAEPAACTACRGTGTVISNLGGSPNQIPCPWCDGTGHRIPGHDAQAARRGG